MRQENWFKFNSYQTSGDRQSTVFHYKIGLNDQIVDFAEKIILPLKIPDSISSDILDKILQSLHLILGISYWKMYCPKKIIIPYKLSKQEAEFWNTVYTKGLGEFYFKNRIDYRKLDNIFHSRISKQRSRLSRDDAKKHDNKTLVGIGGGKDSIVAVEKLKKEKKDLTGYILLNKGENPKIKMDVLKIMEIPYFVVSREMDEKMLNPVGFPVPYNGHVPISAIYAFVGLLLAAVYEYNSIVTANEKSANFGNVEYLGELINHQWSKSEEFENMFQGYVKRFLTFQVRYGSVVRQMTELEITKEFIKYKQYFHYFSSCNKNFSILHKQNTRWCGKCAKCCYTFVMLAAFLPKKEVIEIFGKDLLADESLAAMYRDLRGEGKMKPFDCVGTAEEVRRAFEMIKKL